MLGYAPRILDHLTPVERLYVDHIMSQPFKVPANSTDALELFAKRSRARKKNQGQGSGLPPQGQGGTSDANQQKRGSPRCDDIFF